MVNIIQTLTEDYSHFPEGQTYDIYAEDVIFEDPVNQFQGRKRYQEMISWMGRWFENLQLDLHAIEPLSETWIRSQWTLSWDITLLPWHPCCRVDGWTDFELNEAGLIQAHRDYWKCSRADVLKQVLIRRGS